MYKDAAKIRDEYSPDTILLAAAQTTSKRVTRGKRVLANAIKQIAHKPSVAKKVEDAMTEKSMYLVH